MTSGNPITFSIVVGATPERGIGFKGGLPWPRLTKDMQWFKKITCEVQHADRKNAVIMGRRTWESISPKFRPLDGRLNIILTRSPVKELTGRIESGYVCKSLDEALEICEKMMHTEEVENVFVIGGARLYSTSFFHPQCKTIYYTEIHKSFDCDTFIDPIPQCFKLRANPDTTHQEKEIEFSFKIFDRVPSIFSSAEIANDTKHEELQYLSLIKDVLYDGFPRQDRTGTGTIA